MLREGRKSTKIKKKAVWTELGGWGQSIGEVHRWGRGQCWEAELVGGYFGKARGSGAVW